MNQDDPFDVPVNTQGQTEVRSQPPPIICRPPGQRPLREAWRAFFSLTGGSPVYCMSAMSIVYGIASILGPSLAKADFLREALPCLGALNLYELALMAVLAGIVAGRRVMDDAISLVVLVALFLAGTGITLTAVADSAARVALWIGVGCVLLAAGKLVTLRRVVGLGFSNLVFGACLALLAWFFLAGAMFGTRLGGAPGASAERGPWLWSWVVVLAAGTALLVDAVRRRDDQSSPTDKRAPFLRQPVMVWVFGLLLLIAAVVHQNVLAYIFDVPTHFGDYLPAINLICLFLVQFSLSLRKRADEAVYLLSLAPLGGAVVTVINGGCVSGPSGVLQWGWHPAVLLATTGGLLFWIARLNRVKELRWISAGYAFGVLLLARPVNQLAAVNLNWQLAGGLLTVTLFVTGIMRRKPAICFAAVVVGALGVFTAETCRDLVCRVGLAEPSAFAGIVGLGSMVLALFFGTATPPAVILTGAVGLMITAFHFVTGAPSWRDVVLVVVLLGLMGAVWWRTRHAGVLILAVPLPFRIWVVFSELASWSFVLLGFLLLFGGGAMSWWKGNTPAARGDNEKPSGG